MTPAPRPRIDPDALLAHRPWVRALAVSLTRDAADADDVEQETWLAALDRAPADLRTPRAWFVTVARNVSRRLARAESRRRRREGALLPAAAHPSAAELTAQAEAHRAVVAAVLALDDVHREAVLLRYFEGLSVRNVASRAGVPLETARARLRRARAKLRERLGAEHGGDDGWRLALLPLVGAARPARDGASAAAVATGGALVASKTVVACTVVALVAGVVWWQVGGEDGASPPHAETASLAETTSPTSPRAASSAGRAAAPAGDDAPPPSAPSAPSLPARAGEAPPRTAAERLADPVEPIEFVDAPLPEALGRLSAETGVRIVLAKEVAARLAETPGSLHVAVEGSLPGKTLVELAARTQGFEVEFEDDRVLVVPAGGSRDRTLEVVAVPQPSAPLPTILVRGTVSDEGGVGVPDATVLRIADARVLATTDADGRFEFRCRRPLPTVEVRAPGRAASEAQPVALDEGESSEVARSLHFVVGRASGTLVVRVTAGGLPVAGAFVTIGTEKPVPPILLGEDVRVQRSARRFSGADGRVTFESVPPGTTRALAGDQDHREGSVEVHVVAGQTAEVELALVATPALLEHLDGSRVSFEFRESSPQVVLEFLARISHTNIVVLPDAAETARTAKVTLSAKDLPLSQALRDVCDGAGGLTFELDEANRMVFVKKRTE